MQGRENTPLARYVDPGVMKNMNTDLPRVASEANFVRTDYEKGEEEKTEKRGIIIQSP